MSLNIALYSALSGLQAQQSNLSLISNNIANASTEGYTRKTAPASQRVVDGVGAGVELAEVKRNVEQALLRDIRESTSVLWTDKVAADYHQSLQDLFGAPGDDSSLSADLDRFSSSLEALSASPESTTMRNVTLAEAEALAKKIAKMSAEVQKLRGDAETEIGQQVTELNAQLERIDELNDKIKLLVVRGESTAELEDQRDLAVAAVSEIVNIQTFERATGELVVLTTEGTLVDAVAATVTHGTASILSADSSYADGDLDGIHLNGRDLTKSLKDGKIKGLIELRDRELPKLQAELDALASTLRDEMNAVSNTGTAYPPPNSLTGSQLFASADDAVSVSGTLRLAVVDKDGQAARNIETAPPLEIDFDALIAGASITDPVTLTDLVAAINTQAQANPPAAIEASLETVDGQVALKLAARNANFGIVVDQGTAQIASLTPVATGVAEAQALGNGDVPKFGHFFGLNDIFVADGFPTGSSDIVGLSGQLKVAPGLSGNSSRLPTASASFTLPLTDSQAVIEAGDASVASALAAKLTETLQFAAAGGLPSTQTSLVGYASEVVYRVANDAARNESTTAIQSSLNEELTFRSQSQSAVNVDEELAQMIIVQQAYSASARVISTAQELFDVLQNMVR